MNVLVVNAGSSSLKYKLINVETHHVLASGLCERIGSEESLHVFGTGTKKTHEVFMPDHNHAIAEVLDVLIHDEDAAISSLSEIRAVGHRVVQGGKYFSHSVVITPEVIEKIDELAELAPLHNKAALNGIYACEENMPGTPMVAVFDTAFYSQLLPAAYMYAIPYEFYEKHAIRKYGAHGTSHRYVAHRAATFMEEPIEDLKIITCHLGNGCSITAVDHGIAVDTSMGLTPLDGLMMGTRSGNIDPAVVTYLMGNEGMSVEAINNMLNKESGLLGISGISNDMRNVQEAAQAGSERARLALDMFAYSVKKYIGQYIMIMGGVDAIILTAGIGENSPLARRMIFAGMQPMGIILDIERNSTGSGEREISSDKSNVKIYVIPTDEEYMIARDTFALVHDQANLDEE